jgi:PAS domain S-box-containing protein
MSPEMTPATVMIIDDDPESLRALSKMLIQQRYIVRSFPSGPSALRSAEKEPPDLILLDIRMPGIDGFEVCTRLKENDTLSEIPILFLSAVDETEGKVKAFELGAADFITKPFQIEEVLARVKTHISLKEANSKLQRLNQELERRVQERTAELVEANSALKHQMEERLTAEQALQVSEEKFRRIVTTANEGIATTNDGFQITYANQVLADLLGGSVDDIVGQPGLNFIFEEDRTELEGHFTNRRSGNRSVYECRIKPLDGEARWVIVSASPIMNSKKRFDGSVVLVTDITDRKRSEMELEAAYQEICELRKQIEADNVYLQEELKLQHNFEEIIGESDEIKYALFRVQQVASTDSAVLILGETGTGKELIARAIHNASNRSNRPLIKVNCATLPEQFVESELFGHEKGAYTGAEKRRQGRFELAHHSTIFLDEIGELPLSLQVKLLRVLEHGEFERLGDSQTLKTDVRVIAATNRNLEELVQIGTFREDLWYRLNVFPITLPPLRRRKEDIPLLVNHFIRKIGKKIGKKINQIDKKVLDELAAYDWPGNIRELEHLIERSMITLPGNIFQITEPLAPRPLRSTPDAIEPLASMEREHILRALEQTKWVIGGPKGAAKILELKPNTLRYRMQKLNIEPPKE